MASEEKTTSADALDDDEPARWTLQQRLAARKDPRRAAILAEITAYTWPNGTPMVTGGWQGHMATYVMAAVHAAEATLTDKVN